MDWGVTFRPFKTYDTGTARMNEVDLVVMKAWLDLAWAEGERVRLWIGEDEEEEK